MFDRDDPAREDRRELLKLFGRRSGFRTPTSVNLSRVPEQPANTHDEREAHCCYGYNPGPIPWRFAITARITFSHYSVPIVRNPFDGSRRHPPRPAAQAYRGEGMDGCRKLHEWSCPSRSPLSRRRSPLGIRHPGRNSVKMQVALPASTPS